MSISIHRLQRFFISRSNVSYHYQAIYDKTIFHTKNTIFISENAKNDENIQEVDERI